MNNDPAQFKIEFFLSAAQCNAEGELPLPTLLQYLIDIATSHANSLNFGYSRLKESDSAWVLNRVAVEMESFPAINQKFTLSTWVVSTNRLYSDRAFRFDDAEGNIIGYAISRWAAINVTTRRPMNLLELFPEGLPDTGISVPITSFSKIRHPEEEGTSSPLIFKYADIDCNRHVNSTRYVEHLLNCFSVHFFDTHSISRFEIVFHDEAFFGDHVDVISHVTDTEATVWIALDKKVLTISRFTFLKKE